MSTFDVPGHVPTNRDTLAAGCWAEHDDGSLLYVQQMAEGQVIYSLYGHGAEWPGIMGEVEFKQRFSWQDKKPLEWKWLWHDKTPFDWKRVARGHDMDLGFPGEPAVEIRGPSAAEKVANDLALRLRDVGERIGPRAKREIKDFISALSGRLPD